MTTMLTRPAPVMEEVAQEVSALAAETETDVRNVDYQPQAFTREGRID